jgi:hypothetical protein
VPKSSNDISVRQHRISDCSQTRAPLSRPNADAASLPALSDAIMAELRAIYDQDIRPFVHQRW